MAYFQCYQGCKVSATIQQPHPVSSAAYLQRGEHGNRLVIQVWPYTSICSGELRISPSGAAESYLGRHDGAGFCEKRRIVFIFIIYHVKKKCNPYVQVFRQARDIVDTYNVRDMCIRIITTRPRGQYIRPTADEVAALIVGGEGAEATGHDIILRTVAGNVKRLYGTHPSYMALQYPLLFPFGTDGWVRGSPSTESSSNRREGVTLLQYYAFRIQFRVDEVNILLRGGRLFLQFVVDCYTIIEHEHLRYIRDHQNMLRI